MNVEERLNALEKKCEELQFENERLSAFAEITNLFAEYESIHNLIDEDKTWTLFAQHTPNTWCEVSNWGRFNGIDAIREMWENIPKSLTLEEKRGMMFVHGLMSPCIEVARDGKTAKATWLSSGHETKFIKGDHRSTWCWGNYGVDFVKEDGIWRIWHFKWFRCFITDYYTSWVDRKGDAVSGGNPNGKKFHDTDSKVESTLHKPWTTSTIQVTLPPRPQPYDTWHEEDDGWFLKPLTPVEGE